MSAQTAGVSSSTIALPRASGVSLWIASAYAIVPVAGLLFVLLTSYAALSAQTYASANGATPELLPGHSAGQTFTARYDRLDGIRLHVGTYVGIAQSGLVLHLKQKPGGADIAAASVDPSGIESADTWYSFRFPPVEGSQDREFYVEVESPGSAPGRAVALFWWKAGSAGGDTYPQGAAYLDGAPQPADLAFGLDYSPSPPAQWAQIARAVSAQAPVPLLLLPGVLFAVALAFCAYAARRWGARSRLLLLGLLSLSLAQGILYSLAVPPWQGPDEPSHFAYAALLDRHGMDASLVQGLDLNKKDRDAALESALALSLNRHDFTRYFPGYPAPGAPIEPGASVYSEVHQPPAYYWLCAAAFRTIGLGIDPYANPAAALRLMRLVSVLLSLGVVFLAWLAGLLLAGGRRSWLPALLPLTVILLPMHAFTDSMANNDVLAELAVCALFVALVALVRWPYGLRGALFAAGVVAVAVLSTGTKQSALAAALPLVALGLLAWLFLLVSRWLSGRALATVVACVAVLSFLAVLLAPALASSPLGTAAQWKLNSSPIMKAPIARLHNAPAGLYALSLPVDASTSQDMRVTSPAGGEITVRGYARSGVAGSAATAIVRLESGGISTRTTLSMSPGSGWLPFSVTIKPPAGATSCTVRLFARYSTTQYDALEVSGAEPLSNPSFESQEVGLRRSLSHFLPQESRWIAEVLLSPQLFSKEHLWGRYAVEQFRSFWGNFGWVAIPLPGDWYAGLLWVSLLALAAVLAAILSRRTAREERLLLAVSLGGLVLAVLIGFARQTMALSLFGVEAFPQGRYLFVLSIPVAWMLLLGLETWASAGLRLLRRSTGRDLPAQAMGYGSWLWANALVLFAVLVSTAVIVPIYYG